MQKVITYLSTYVALISLALTPVAVVAMNMHNNRDKDEFIAEVRAKNPHMGPVWDLDATRITDLKHPFWTKSTLVRSCPTSKTFLYNYKSRMYVGSHTTEGVVQIDSTLDEEGIKKFCS